MMAGAAPNKTRQLLDRSLIQKSSSRGLICGKGEFSQLCLIIVISISRNGLLKSCARFVIERSEIRKKKYDFKSVHFECTKVLLT